MNVSYRYKGMAINKKVLEDTLKFFYRVEIPAKSLKFGIGPYLQSTYYNDYLLGEYTNLKLDRLNILMDNLLMAHSGNDKTPALYTDFPKELINVVNLENYFCGFTNINDLYRWFDGFIDELIELDFKLVKYTVMDIIIGNSKHQAFACDIISREIYELSLCNS